jgi:multimeric flavodoxin WrbA
VSRKVLVLLGSARVGGNTERLARLAVEGLPAHAEVRWLRLAELPLEPFQDLRHAGGYGPPAGHAATLLEATLWATDLLLAAPTYWYGLPAAAKLYLDHWSGWLRAPGVEFKARMAGKTLWAITVNSGEAGDTEGSRPLIRTLELSAGYMAMGFGGALVGHGNRPGEVEQDQVAMAEARGFLLGESGVAGA